MIVHDPQVRHFNEVDTLGVAVIIRGDDIRHVALLYKIQESGSALLCHLGDHEVLLHNAPDDRFFWLELELDGGAKAEVAAFCDLLKSRGGKVPYGFDLISACFNLLGEYIGGGVGHGLTCATFVASVFESLNYPLIADVREWPRRSEDEIRFRNLVTGMRNRGADEVHLNALEKAVGNARVRPEEVAGATTHDPWPVEYKIADGLGVEVIRQSLSIWGSRAAGRS